MVCPIQRVALQCSLLLLLLPVVVRGTSIAASFRRDVMGLVARQSQKVDPLDAFEEDINHELLEKAMPLKEYEAIYNYNI